MKYRGYMKSTRLIQSYYMFPCISRTTLKGRKYVPIRKAKKHTQDTSVICQEQS